MYSSQPGYAGKISTVSRVSDSTAEVSAGAGCWLARSTWPDLSFDVSMVQQSLNEATPETVRFANNFVKRAFFLFLSTPEVLSRDSSGAVGLPKPPPEADCSFEFGCGRHDHL